MYPGTTTKLTEATMTSANTIEVKTDVVLLNGTTSIQNINPPGMVAGRLVVLVSLTGTINLLNTGNIATAPSININRAVTLYFSKTNRKWYVKN